MNPKIVTIEQAVFVNPLHRQMWVRLTYQMEWDTDCQEVRTCLIGQEVLGEVKADA